MSEVIEKESTELATLPAKESALDVYSAPNGLDPYIERIREEVTGHTPDLSTRKGREAIASLAFKVRKAKAALDALGKEQVDKLKEIPKLIDAERKRMRDQLDALADEVRAPLDEWEAAEQQRVANHKHELVMLEGFSECGDLDAAMIRANIEHIEGLQIDDGWEEFEAEAHRVKGKTLDAMRTALMAREKYEAEQAELARLRAEAEARRIQDEKERIAREAAEAATRAAEAKAQAEREAAAKREADARAAQEKAEQDAKDAIERQKQAEARAEAEKLAAEERAKQAAEAARLAEIERQQQEKARIEAEQRKREADKAHKAKIMGAAKEGLMAAGITEDQARAAVKLIVAGKVPNVRIHF